MLDFLKKLFSNKKSSNQVEFQAYIGVDKEVVEIKDKIDELLKLATSLKKEKRFDEACNTLEKAYQVGGEHIHLKDRLRLSMYLQLAKKNDEGWEDISFLFATKIDFQSQYIIANQIRIFLQKEKKNLSAVPYGIYSLCREIDYYLEQIELKQFKLQNESLQKEFYNKADKDTKMYYDGKWEENKIMILLEPSFISSQISKLLKKAKYEKFKIELINKIQSYIMNNYKKDYNYSDIKKICKVVLIDS